MDYRHGICRGGEIAAGASIFYVLSAEIFTACGARLPLPQHNHPILYVTIYANSPFAAQCLQVAAKIEKCIAFANFGRREIERETFCDASKVHGALAAVAWIENAPGKVSVSERGLIARTDFGVALFQYFAIIAACKAIQLTFRVVGIEKPLHLGEDGFHFVRLCDVGMGAALERRHGSHHHPLHPFRTSRLTAPCGKKHRKCAKKHPFHDSGVVIHQYGQRVRVLDVFKMLHIHFWSRFLGINKKDYPFLAFRLDKARFQSVLSGRDCGVGCL